ncbi:unnamed protein product [Schistocephalus solidus]|uniref:Uncharacterized protein n=1 Tax=Schistocephalus solidus TaxID=70667 RepID=A0A183SNP9_SCHSO|nr:unnamed protein product [Schistocephalus solidus]
MKNFFKAIKTTYGPCIKGAAPLLSSDGATLLTEKSQILKRRAEHFRSVLNCASAISDAAIGRLPQVDTNTGLDLPPSQPETIWAVQPISSGAPLLSSDGATLLTEKSQILKRWAEHFRSVLNCASAISDAAIGRLPQVDTNTGLDLPPSQPETIWAVQPISSGKAPGSDAIPPEVYKHGGPRLIGELTTLFQEMWRQGQVP